jgi:hypothetical protein
MWGTDLPKLAFDEFDFGIFLDTSQLPRKRRKRL